MTAEPPDPRLRYRLVDCASCGLVDADRWTSPARDRCPDCGAAVVEVEVRQVREVSGWTLTAGPGRSE